VAKGIALELLYAVDGIIKENLRGLEGVDVVQCLIDHPTIRDGAVGGMVIYHNVIQHLQGGWGVRSLVDEPQPDSTKVLNQASIFCAISFDRDRACL